jgi:hypothetical protein
MKRKRLRITPDLLADFLVSPVPPGISTDAPLDLRIVGCCWLLDDDVIELIVSSDSFAEVPTGEVLPLMKVTFHRETRA